MGSGGRVWDLTMGKRLVDLSVHYPKSVIALALLITGLFAAQLPKIRMDTDPKNMLPITSPVRQYNDQVEGWFGLHADVLVLGVYRETGLFNRESLDKIMRITEEIYKLRGVVARDIISLSTVDDVMAVGDLLQARPLLTEVPTTVVEAEAIRRRVLANRPLLDRLVSKDGKTTALYIPLEKGANGKVIADQIRRILERAGGPEAYYLAGDPVVRDTFGVTMFQQMAFLSPIAGMIMFVVLFLIFRSWALVVANMAVAMLCIIWAMGLFVGLGFPIHIMASMSPVFLMAISTDTVHIFNEFYFRFREIGTKREAIQDTMRVVSAPVLYSDLTTAAGFASLAIGPIIPVRVFGLLVAFGTLAILLMSFTLVPAMMALMPEKKLAQVSLREELRTSGASGWLLNCAKLILRRRAAVVLVGLALTLISILGLQRIRVNNNMVHWFKPQSAIREADRILNDRLGGTATLYLVATAQVEGAMTDPQVLRHVEGVQRYLERHALVGKTLSVADYVRRVNRVLHQDDPNFEVIPDSQESIAQYLLLFSMAAKPRDLNSVVDYPYQKANIFVQLRSWDAVDARRILADVQSYIASHPVVGVEYRPAGIAYFNMVWNEEVLVGMLSGFILSSILVFFLLILDFRSFKWGIVSFLPLLFTILVIYGVVGFVGKDFDMPISVLSTLSLGMAVDFAIHFVTRFRQRFRETQDVDGALLWTVARPGKGILRNALLFAIGFSVMIFSALTPYITVGVFMIAIMLLSAGATLVYLPALISLWPALCSKETREGSR